MSEKIWSDDAWQDYLYWQTQDKKTLKRINLLRKNQKVTMTVLEKICEVLDADFGDIVEYRK